jgi:DNA-binding NtrC family response regulator
MRFRNYIINFPKIVLSAAGGGQVSRDTAVGFRILLIEKDQGLSEILRHLLRSQDNRVRSCDNLEDVQALLADGRPWDACFLDTAIWRESLQSETCEDILAALVNCPQPVPVLMLAAYADFALAEDAVKQGAFGWLPKPLRAESALEMLERALAQKRQEPSPLGQCPAASDAESSPVAAMPAVCAHYGYLIGEHPRMLELYRQMEKAAATEMTVLIQGESGTGKELVAHAIHDLSNRRGGPFLAINCASVPETLLESELFGHVKGAFTGATQGKDGLFLAASGGTLFLDEIGSIPLSMQLALLRVLQEHEIRPVGSVKSLPVDVRVVAATNENLTQLLQQGLFRNDLYFRLSAFPLFLPPLRDRKSDVALLTADYLHREAEGMEVSSEVMAVLERYDWPGNVRQLLNVLNRAKALTENKVLELTSLPYELLAEAKPAEEAAPQPVPAQEEKPRPMDMTLKAYLKMCERRYVRQVLDYCSGNKEQAARVLGISTATLYRKCEELEK